MRYKGGVFRTGLTMLLVALSVPGSALAQDQPRVAVLQLSGRRAGPATRLVRRAAEEHAQVVDADQDDPGDAAGRGALAQQLGVDLVITGTSAGSRRRARLELTFTDASGQERATETGTIPPGGRGRRALRRLMSRAFEAVGPIEPQPAVAPEPEIPEEAYQEPTEEPEESSGSGYTSSVPEFARGADEYRPWLRLHVGVSTRNRSLDLEVPGAPVRHNVALYPEFLAEAEVRPLAFLRDDTLYGLRVRIRFEYALYWESLDDADNVIGGTQYGFGADAGYLVPLADIVEIGGSLGGGHSAYQLDPNAFVPSVEYSHFEIRAITRIRAFGELLVLSGELGYRYARGSGLLTEQFGDLDGNGVVFAGGIGGTVLFDPAFGFDYGFELEWQRVWFSFGGMPSGMLAEGGSDELVRGRFLVGMSFH